MWIMNIKFKSVINSGENRMKNRKHIYILKFQVYLKIKTQKFENNTFTKLRWLSTCFKMYCLFCPDAMTFQNKQYFKLYLAKGVLSFPLNLVGLCNWRMSYISFHTQYSLLKRWRFDSQQWALTVLRDMCST
jgi:hypothetical protein